MNIKATGLIAVGTVAMILSGCSDNETTEDANLGE